MLTICHECLELKEVKTYKLGNIFIVLCNDCKEDLKDLNLKVINA